MAKPLGRAKTHYFALGRMGRADYSGGQSAHQSLWFLGVGHCRNQTGLSRYVVSGRSLHAPKSDAAIGQRRLHAILHLLFVAQLKGRTHRLFDRADAERNETLFSPQFLAKHARHQSAAAPNGPRTQLLDSTLYGRHDVGQLWHFWAYFRVHGERRVSRQRRISKFRKIRNQALGLGAYQQTDLRYYANQPSSSAKLGLATNQ